MDILSEKFQTEDDRKGGGATPEEEAAVFTLSMGYTWGVFGTDVSCVIMITVETALHRPDLALWFSKH